MQYAEVVRPSAYAPLAYAAPPEPSAWALAGSVHRRAEASDGGTPNAPQPFAQLSLRASRSRQCEWLLRKS